MSARDGRELEERKAARDSWRRTGGSARRPLSSFSTAAEKKANRLEHAARLADAVSAFQTQTGYADWIRSLELNPRRIRIERGTNRPSATGRNSGNGRFLEEKRLRHPQGRIGRGMDHGSALLPSSGFHGRTSGRHGPRSYGGRFRGCYGRFGAGRARGRRREPTGRMRGDPREIGGRKAAGRMRGHSCAARFA